MGLEEIEKDGGKINRNYREKCQEELNKKSNITKKKDELGTISKNIENN